MTTDSVADALFWADQEEASYRRLLLRKPWGPARSSRSAPCKSGDHHLCLGALEGDPVPGIHRGILRCACLCHSEREGRVP